MQFDHSFLPPSLHVGTSSFSAPDWSGVFYPSELQSHDFLSYYAQKFRTVEIDATWHYMPNPKTVEAWAKKVPEGFLFAAKVPKEITHERLLKNCGEDWEYFLETMEGLGPKLGALLFQFQYVSKRKDPREHETGEDFLRRLEAFVPLLPENVRCVVEVRNPLWLNETLTDLLRSNGIALALVDYVTMPRPAELFERCDPVTADFTYVRFLGDHHAMDNMVAQKREKGSKKGDWNELLVDRSAEMGEWVPALQRLTKEVSDVFVYFNNHYAGFAPGSIELFLRIWKEMVGGQTSEESRS